MAQRVQYRTPINGTVAVQLLTRDVGSFTFGQVLEDSGRACRELLSKRPVRCALKVRVGGKRSTPGLVLSDANKTPTSYLSRVAARNFCSSMTELCLDVGLDLTLLSTGSAESLSQAAQLTGLQSGFFDHTVIIKTSSMKYCVGGESMDTETLARGDVRVCPRCVADKLANGGEIWEVIHRHHWQVRQIQRCLSHGCSLLKLKPEVQGNIRLDATYLIRQNIDQILHAASQSSTAERADEIDIYLSRRVYGHNSSLWCDTLPIPALYRASEALGTLLLHDRHAERRFLSKSERRRAFLRGFQVLADGPERIREALEQFTSRNQHNSNGHSAPQYGDFHLSVIQALGASVASTFGVEDIDTRKVRLCAFQCPSGEGGQFSEAFVRCIAD
ncbi:TniQ family protein [Ruegeria sp. Ofav3-42]|uniref:TniQ family protein n=1 Tax=Ruegeria sp. Ofav3-42 TaxID=2917759 RepID=UPI001EF62F33|nr:TniQ family protein [Ruegeria sp. Ofav3-42]MCG7521612.1 TniQ family protein [Ruegeria sp. Ofav3-42]